MVDTIIMRVHDLRKHEQLVKELETNFKGTTKNTALLTEEESQLLQNCQTLNQKDFIKFFYNAKDDNLLVHYSTQEKLNSSGHYYLNAFVNYDRDYIEFNFSVPKYLFGTNIMMFCEHHWNRDFNFSLNSSFVYNLKCTYDRLLKFIPSFFNKEFVGNNLVDYSLLEINRIDIAFNQVFDNKKFALNYLEYQKKIRKKHLRADSDSFRAYETSLMYYTKRYSFKIYHKGSEYKKHDRKEHLRINKEKGREYFNIDELQAFSDRILRYEVTLRGSMLSYIFNHKIFRKKCPVHKANYEIFKKVEALKNKNDVIATNAKFFPEGIFRDQYLKTHPYFPIDKTEAEIHKKMNKLLSLEKKFYLKTNRFIEEYNSSSISSETEPRALFSKALMIECSRFFKKNIMAFQVTKKPPESIVRERIEKYNSENYHKLPVNEMLKFYALLKNSSFEEIMKTGPYSRATYYRYRCRFEKIGITQNSIMPIDYIHPTIDLSMYHHCMIYNKKLINK